MRAIDPHLGNVYLPFLGYSGNRQDPHILVDPSKYPIKWELKTDL